MLPDDHPERQTQKKTKLENNFKKETQMETPIWFCAKLTETGYFSAF